MNAGPPVRPPEASLRGEGPGVAVTPHHLASAAAVDILHRGGNAVDAAIAADAVLGVVAPETCGIGGDLFALIHKPGATEPDALNASGRAGSGTNADAVRSAGHKAIPIRSPWAVTVPGCVDGWEALAGRYGRLTLAAALEPAIGLAAGGFPVGWELAQSLARLSQALAPQESAAGLYPDGAPPDPGTMIIRPGLAATLGRIAAEGRAASYDGPIGEMISAATDGTILPEDLSMSQADWVDPVSIDIMGQKAWTIPPNSQGYLTLAAAWLFEHLEPPRDPADPLFTHAAIEAYRAVAWERDLYVSDPAHSPIDPGALLDPTRLARKLDHIKLSARADWPVPQRAPGGTAYLCVRDRDGLGISLIQSNYHGIGSTIGVGSAGFFLHDRGSGFSLEPGHPNELAPGKRPLHTLSPTLWTQDASLSMLLGTRGGDFQPQTLLQMSTYMLWAGRTADEAHTLPRWVTKEWRDGDSAVQHEPGYSEAALSRLDGLGHRLAATGQPMAGWGPVSVITDTGDAGKGAADPRVATTAAIAT